MATAREQYKEQKTDSPHVGRWLKWARRRFMPARSVSYESGLRKRLLEPSYALEYLRVALDADDGDRSLFRQGLRDVYEAYRGEEWL